MELEGSMMKSPPAPSTSFATPDADGNLFTPSWCRTRRVNDVLVAKSSKSTHDELADTTTTPTPTSLSDDGASLSLANPSSSNNNTNTNNTSNSHDWWQKYPCLVCGKDPDSTMNGITSIKEEEEEDVNSVSFFKSISESSETTAASSSSSQSTLSHHHKRCSRCHSAIYCSTECQRQDYIHGKHKANCTALGKLWKEKADLENCLWERKKERHYPRSTNPFDDDDDKVESGSNSHYPKVGEFWHDHPQSTIQKTTTLYCVTLLQLVQLLGRGESWRVSRVQHPCQRDSSECNYNSSRRMRRRGPGNPLARELAIDIAFTLLQLDRTDMRVRLLIPSLLLEGEYYQEAYDFLKHWLHVDASLMIMDLALLGGGGNVAAGEEEEEEGTAEHTTNLMKFSNCDMLEPPEIWMDGEMVYPSVGMVFELAFLKCHMLCSLRSGRVLSDQQTGGDPIVNECTSIIERCSAMGGEDELERQVKLLLSLAHKWNPYLLPNLAETYDNERGTSSSSPENAVTSPALEKGMVVPATPPALSTLLNKHPPGFELQYKMGNPGGGSVEEAVAIWQRDMILWHVVDPMAMQYLSNFCLNLENNLVDTHCLNGVVKVTSDEGHNGSPHADVDLPQSNNAESAQMRKEAEGLAKELQKQYPDRTMDEIMMHPEMAQLMIKHLRNATT